MNELLKKLEDRRKQLDSLVGEYIGTYPKPYGYKEDVKRIQEDISEIEQEILLIKKEQEQIMIEQEIDYDEGLL